MAKLAARDVDSFLAKPTDGIWGALIYGPDSGLIRERAQKLMRSVAGDASDPFRVAELTAGQVKEQPSLLADEMAALSLIGGRRAVRLRGAGNAEAKALAMVLDANSGDSVLVVEAGELGPRDALRSLFEKHKHAVAVACYGDEGQGLDSLIRGILGREGHEPEPDAAAMLGGMLGTDRGLTRQELEKLALYKGKGGGPVTLADVRACIGDDAPLAREDVALAAGSGDQQALDRALSRCLAMGESPIAILRAVQRHFDRLHRLALKVQAGNSIEQVMRSARPPIFFKHQAIIRSQLQLWRPAGLAGALGLLTEAELACKTTGNPDVAMCGRALLRIAHAARRERRG